MTPPTDASAPLDEPPDAGTASQEQSSQTKDEKTGTPSSLIPGEGAVLAEDAEAAAFHANADEGQTDNDEAADESSPSRRRRPSYSWRGKDVLAAVAGIAVVLGMASVCFLLFKRAFLSSRRTGMALPQVTASTAEPNAGPVASTPPGSGKGIAYDATAKNLAITTTPIAADSAEATAARRVLDSYLMAATTRDRLAYVYRPERSERLMREFYEKRGEVDPVPSDFIGAARIQAGDSSLVSLSFACPGRPDTGLRANFHRTQSGRLLLDWEEWVAFNEKSWSDFKRARSVIPALMRAVALEDDYYNYEFDARWRFLAVKLRSADGLHSVTGYCERRSGLGIELANLIGVPVPQRDSQQTPHIPIRPPGTKSPVTLRLAFPANAQSDHCAWIIGLVADRWLLFDGEN